MILVEIDLGNPYGAYRERDSVFVNEKEKKIADKQEITILVSVCVHFYSVSDENNYRVIVLEEKVGY